MEAAFTTAWPLHQNNISDRNNSSSSSKRTHHQMATGSVGNPLPFSNHLGGERSDNNLPSTSATPADFPILLPPFLSSLQTMDPTRQTEPETEPVFVVDDDSHTIIDLTADEPDPPPQRMTTTTTTNNNNDRADGASTRATRPPNFDRDIIDVDALPDRPPSPEVQFTYSRPAPHRPAIPPPPSRYPGPAMPVELRPNRAGSWDFLFGGGPTSGGMSSVGALGPLHVRRYHEMLNARSGIPPPQRTGFTRRGHHSHQGVPFGSAVQFGGFIPTGMNPNFTMPHLSYEEPSLREPPPRYDPPEPARQGFTRSPKEGDMVVCPNCDDELGTGDTEEKRSVWFVKACGHGLFLNKESFLQKGLLWRMYQTSKHSSETEGRGYEMERSTVQDLQGLQQICHLASSNATDLPLMG
ncbi:MAG: hypothetical protein M1816_007098 [Peltula sp. TS41687]|nr:MAG: hypothetical protein M1816_007098 [Peltula sp. TS41687]